MQDKKKRDEALTERKATVVRVDHEIGRETKGEYEFIDCPETLARLIEEHIGRDAADYFRDCIVEAKEIAFDPSKCPGECDRVYKMQEHYQRVIRDTVENLREAEIHPLGRRWTSGKVDVSKYEQVIESLCREI